VSGLLVVNADDWGGSEATTNAILRTFEAGRITSTSGMVFMPDSERAAEIATRQGLPVGLHLNLTEPFGDPRTPVAVRDRQLRAVERLAGNGRDGHPGTARLRKWIYDPTIRADVDRAIADQLERFEALYGGPPSHFDGHNYVDACPNVFLSRSIPAGSLIRNSLDCYPLVRSATGRLKGLRQRLRTRRLRSTGYLLHIAQLELGDDTGPDPRLRLAKRASVEVMAHPDDETELAALMSPAWERVLGEYKLGSFADV
jgi:chitin disaccharide deacetylase